MANITDQMAEVAIPSEKTHKHYLIPVILDLALGATGDIYYPITIPAGHKCLDVVCEVVEATGETATAAVGVYSDLTGTAVDADGFDASVDLNATAGTRTHGVGGTDALVTAGGYMHATADTYIGLVLTVSSSPLGALGQLKVTAEMVDFT